MAVPSLRFKGFEGEWKAFKLKQLIKDLQSGISVNSEDISITNDSEYGILKTSAVSNGIFTESENKKIVEEEISRAKLNPTKDEIIISRMNTPQLVGESGYIDKTYPNLFIPDRLWQTVIDTNKCHSKWLSYFLITDRVRYDLKSIATGTSGSMKNISKPNFLGIKVNYPSLPEQRKIADFLSAVDEKIRLLSEKKEKLETYKKGVMQKLFPKQGQTNPELRFKRSDGSAFPDWEEKRLGDYLIQHNEVTTENNQYPVLTSSREGIMFQTEYYSGNEVASKDNTGYNVVPRDYFTYRHMSDDLIFKFNINTICDRGIVSTLYPVFRTDEEKLNRYFLQYILNEGEAFQRFALLQKQGGSRTYMYFKKLSNLELLLPSINEQKAILRFLNSLSERIDVTSTQLDQMKDFKKGLLQQMFV